MKIEFFVPGIPATAGSKRAIHNPKTGKTAVFDDCKRNKVWSSRVIDAAREAYQGPPLSGAIHLDLWFLFPRPKCHYGTGKNANVLKASAPFHYTKKPDRCKLERCIEDALTGIIWKDDSQVIDGAIRKSWTELTPGAKVTIETLE